MLRLLWVVGSIQKPWGIPKWAFEWKFSGRCSSRSDVFFVAPGDHAKEGRWGRRLKQLTLEMRFTRSVRIDIFKTSCTKSPSVFPRFAQVQKNVSLNAKSVTATTDA
jgi:hypothetical protein